MAAGRDPAGSPPARVDAILPETKSAFRFAREREDEVTELPQPSAAPPRDQLTVLIADGLMRSPYLPIQNYGRLVTMGSMVGIPSAGVDKTFDAATSGFGGLRTWPTIRHGSSTTRMTPSGH
jgi:hypothetical protein